MPNSFPSKLLNYGGRTKAFSTYEVSGYLAFILLLSSATGLAPMRFQRVPEKGDFRWKLAPSLNVQLYSWIFTFTITIFSAWGSYKEIHILLATQSGYKSIQTFVIAVDNIIIITINIVAVLTGPKRVKEIVKILDILYEVDLLLGKEKLKLKERRALPWFMAVSGLALAVLIWVCISERYDKASHTTQVFQEYFSYYLQYFILTLMELQFMAIVYAVQIRYQELADVLEKEYKNNTTNNALKLMYKADWLNIHFHTYFNTISRKVHPKKLRPMEITKESANKNDGTVSFMPCHVRLERIADMRLQLTDVIQMTCDAFGYSLTLLLLAELIHLIDIPYFFIIDMNTATLEVFIHEVFHEMTFFSWTLLRLILLIEPCHRCIKAEEKIKILLTMMPNNNENSKVKKQLKRLWRHQIGGGTIAFTALGVCTLNRELIASIAGTITTYLVILIQFQNQE